MTKRESPEEEVSGENGHLIRGKGQISNGQEAVSSGGSSISGNEPENSGNNGGSDKENQVGGVVTIRPDLKKCHPEGEQSEVMKKEEDGENEMEVGGDEDKIPEELGPLAHIMAHLMANQQQQHDRVRSHSHPGEKMGGGGGAGGSGGAGIPLLVSAHDVPRWDRLRCALQLNTDQHLLSWLIRVGEEACRFSRIINYRPQIHPLQRCNSHPHINNANNEEDDDDEEDDDEEEDELDDEIGSSEEERFCTDPHSVAYPVPHMYSAPHHPVHHMNNHHQQYPGGMMRMVMKRGAGEGDGGTGRKVMRKVVSKGGEVVSEQITLSSDDEEEDEEDDEEENVSEGYPCVICNKYLKSAREAREHCTTSECKVKVVCLGCINLITLESAGDHIKSCHRVTRSDQEVSRMRLMMLRKSGIIFAVVPCDKKGNDEKGCEVSCLECHAEFTTGMPAQTFQDHALCHVEEKRMREEEAMMMMRQKQRVASAQFMKPQAHPHNARPVASTVKNIAHPARSPLTTFHCLSCGQYFKAYSQLQRHKHRTKCGIILSQRAKHHTMSSLSINNSDEIEDDDEDEVKCVGGLRCGKCGFQCANQAQLSLHLASKHKKS